MILKANEIKGLTLVSYQQASGSSWTNIYHWRVCGLIEWFKRKTNTELAQDITGQSFVGDL